MTARAPVTRRIPRLPAGSITHSRPLPALIVGLALILVVPGAVAAGVLLRYVPYR